MAYSRFSRREIVINDSEGYEKEFFEPRGIKQVIQYTTPVMRYPTNEEMASLNLTTAVWGATDKIYNVADAAYGSPELWWVIAWFNKKSCAVEFKVGDVYYIPQPLNRVLEMYGV